jgi:tetratricopeptide (TPR) repeat protein
MLTENSYAAVFTIRASNQTTISASFSNIGKLGGLEATENAGKHYLSQFKTPWLLIIDNADDPETNIFDLLPDGNNAHVLVTTRNPDLREYGYAGSLELRGLDEEDALTLLLQKAGIVTPWDMTTRTAGLSIVKALGYLAIALIQAGKCIYRKICGLGDYLNLYEASRIASRAQRKDTVADVYLAFDMSLDLHTRQESLPGRDASDLLKIVAFFHFERIPVDIFIRAVHNRERLRLHLSRPSPLSRIWTEIWRQIGSTAPLPSFLERSTLNHYDVKVAMSELRSRSLITYDEKDQSISLHPLVHSWIRDSFDEFEKNSWSAIAFGTLMESISLPSAESPPDGEYHKQILPHLESCLLEHGNPLMSSDEPTHVAHRMGAVQSLSLWLFQYRISYAAKCGYVFAERGKFQKATAHLEAVKDALMQLRGIRNNQTMTATLGLARVYWGLGRLDEAIKLQKLVRDAKTDIYGPDDEQTLQVMDQLAMSYWFHGYYKEARDLIQITTERMKDVLGESHSTTIAGLDHLGIIYGAWQQYDECLRTHERVLAIRQLELGDEHLDTIESKNNYAVALLDLERLDEAKTLMIKVHEQRQRLLGKEHPWTLWSYLHLARINIEMKCYVEAEEMIIWGLQAGERSLEKEHIGVLAGRGWLARVYTRTGRVKEAEILTLNVIKGVERSRGPAHPDTVFALYKLAQLYEIKGEKEKVLEACEKALERVDQRLTREHPMSRQIEDLLRKTKGLPQQKSEEVLMTEQKLQQTRTEFQMKIKRAATR